MQLSFWDQKYTQISEFKKKRIPLHNSWCFLHKNAKDLIREVLNFHYYTALSSVSFSFCHLWPEYGFTFRNYLKYFCRNMKRLVTFSCYPTNSRDFWKTECPTIYIPFLPSCKKFVNGTDCYTNMCRLIVSLFFFRFGS